jgi:peptidoglycan/LPS O-acetylase OafA/YrhL
MKGVTLLTRSRALELACALALAALALIVWSIVDPRPIPVILAMSLGQALGTVSFGAFLWVVVRDLRAQRR